MERENLKQGVCVLVCALVLFAGVSAPVGAADGSRLPSVAEIASRRDQIYSNLKAQGKSSDKAAKNRLVVAYGILLQKLAKLESDRSLTESERARLQQEIIELEYATKTEGRPRVLAMGMRYIKGIVNGQYDIPLESDVSNEARNLVDGNRVLSIGDMAKQPDLSVYNPAPDSMFWRDPGDIRGMKMSEVLYGGKMPMLRGLKIEFPTENVFTYDEVKASQTTAKISVTGRDSEGGKTEFTFKFGKETYADPTASALIGAMGYSTDAVKHVSNIKIYLGKTPLDTFKRDFIEYYKPDKAGEFFDLVSYEKQGAFKTGRDEKGEYLWFRSGLLEADPKGVVKVGHWGYTANGHDYLREVRGLMIFNIWVNNVDAWDDNNKLYIVTEGGREELHLSQHDSGASFGHLLMEKLDAFKWSLVGNLDAVRAGRASKVEITNVSKEQNRLAGRITLADARWATRLIAKLDRNQIAEAVALGGWPTEMAQLLTEKLISRRNDLVEAFGLGSEFALITPNKKLTTADNRVVKGKLKNGKYPGIPEDFGNFWGDVAAIPGRAIDKAIRQGIQMGIGSIRHLYKEDDAELGIKAGVVAEVIFGANREFVKNEKATSDLDQYLVQDTVRVGLRLGGGYVVTGDVTKVYQYKLVYPARSEDDAINGYKKLINFTLPFAMNKNKLPPKYVLTREVFLEGAGRLRTPEYSPVAIGLDGKASRVTLSRTIVDNKEPDTIVLHEDRSNYWDSQVRILTEVLGLFRTPILTKQKQFKGKLKMGATYIVDRKEAESRPDLAKAITTVIGSGEFDELSALKQPLEVGSDFDSSGFKLSFFGLFKRENRMNSETVKVSDPRSKEVVVQSARHRSLQSSAWVLLDNNEQQELRVLAYGPNATLQEIKKDPSVIRLKYRLNDVDSKAEELDDGYLALANGLAGDANFIPFRAAQHSHNKRYEKVETIIDVEFSGESLRRLVSLTPEGLWAGMAQAYRQQRDPTMTLEKFLAAKNKYVARTADDRSKLTQEESRLHRAFFHARAFLRRLEKAQSTGDNYERLRQLTRALKEAQYRNEHSFSAWVIGGVVKATGATHLRAVAAPPAGGLPTFPGNQPQKGERGKATVSSEESLLLFPIEIEELYNMFNFADGRRSASR